MRSLLIIALILGLIVPNVGLAGNCIWAGSTVGSYHFNTDKSHNEQNWGPHLELCLGRDDVRIVTGWYRNSRRTDSVYVGIAWFPVEYKVFKLGIVAGRISGYGTITVNEQTRTVEPHDEPQTGAFPVLAIEYKRFGANVMYFPKHGDENAVMAWQAKWKFG